MERVEHVQPVPRDSQVVQDILESLVCMFDCF